jgi:hypothetical protein
MCIATDSEELVLPAARKEPTVARAHPRSASPAAAAAATPAWRPPGASSTPSWLAGADELGGLLARAVQTRAERNAAGGAGLLQRVVVVPDVLTANNVARSQNLVRNLRPTEERLSGTLSGYTAHFHANNYSQVASSPSYRDLTSFTGTFTSVNTGAKYHVTFNEQPTGAWRVSRTAGDDWERVAEDTTWYRLEDVLPRAVAPSPSSSSSSATPPPAVTPPPATPATSS